MSDDEIRRRIEHGIEIVKRDRVDPLGIRPASPRMRELAAKISPDTLRALGTTAFPMWQREILNRQLAEAERRRREIVLPISDVQDATRAFREFARAMRLTARTIAEAFQVPLRLLLDPRRAERERQQVAAMQRWARRRGRRKGRA